MPFEPASNLYSDLLLTRGHEVQLRVPVNRELNTDSVMNIGMYTYIYIYRTLHPISRPIYRAGHPAAAPITV